MFIPLVMYAMIVFHSFIAVPEKDSFS